MRSAALLVLGVLVGLASGCSPRGYFGDRWADAKDIFTVSVGTGGGAKAQVGPFRAGLFINSDIAGLRAGECFYVPGSFGLRSGSNGTGNYCSDLDCVFLILAMESFGPEYKHLETLPENAGALMRERKKSLGDGSVFPYAGILVPLNYEDIPPYSYTQLEVAAGVGGTLRLGFNPGELLDFVLGWFGIDIYGDDLEARWASRMPKVKAALLALMRSAPGLFDGIDPDQLAKLEMKVSGSGQWS